MKRICVSVILLILAAVSWGCTQKADPVKGKIVFTVGTVLVNSAEASVGQEVKDRDRIETKDQSLVRILIGEKTLVQLKQNTTLVYMMRKENTLQLEQGEMSGVTKGKLHKQSYKILTPTAVAAIRGTAYSIKIESPDSTYICTCNGTIFQHGKDNEEHGIDVTAVHHSARRYIRNTDGTVIVEDAKMRYHTDEEIEEIAAFIDETIDWETAN